MKIHVFVALPTSAVLRETRATSLNLDTASSLLLDVLDIRTTVTDNLCTEIEAR